MTASPAPSKLSGTGSARASVDVQSISDKMQQSPSLSSLSSGPPATTSSPSSSTLPSSLGSPTSVFPPSTEETPAIPTSPTAPSAVSRFLNRFSRTKSDVRPSSSDPRSSIALSTDDLEFLSDIVPSHSDGTEDNDGLNELTALTSSAAVPARLPPPLAPPPSPYPLRPVRLSRSQTPQPQPPATVSAAPKPSNVFGDFDELMPQPLASKPTNSGPFAPALPPLLPPPVSPTSVASSSKPSTPSLLPEINKHTSPVRTPPPISWSSSSSPSASFNIPPSGSGLEGLSQLSALTGSINSSAQVPLSSSPLSSPRRILPPRMQQPSESTSHSQFSFSPTSSIPPPPIEKSPNRVFVRSGPRPLDDDFSDFHGHSTSSMVLPRNQLQTSMSFETSFGAQSDQSIMSHHSASQDDSFGDFGDFVTIDPSPAPIRVPASPSPMSRPKAIPPLPPPKKSVPSNISTTHIRKPSAADHHATALLVERAATHLGRWPAPPSPIPELLSPPPLSGKRAKQSESLLEIGQDTDIAPRTVTPTPSIALKSIAQITSATASRAPTPSLSRPTSPPVTNSDLSVHSLLDLSSPAQNTISPAPARTLPPSQQMHSMLQPQPSSNQPTKGGLSAQDLSFFEGL
ncbi:hypothetical protein DFH11DRAFT_1616510 [Phellopilus nigrolimitatus]|nr:hypothetical protein DFH11DRAFT_1616510 [Phellopilus nigrolimitatus]